MNKTLSKLKKIIPIAISLAVFVMVLLKMDLIVVKTIIKDADLSSLAKASFVVLVLLALIHTRWVLTVRLISSKLTHWELFKISFIGSFFGQILPTNVGSDATKIILLRINNFNNQEAFSSVILDRLVGLTSLMSLVIAGVFFHPNTLSSSELGSMLSSISGFCLLLFFVMGMFYTKLKYSKMSMRIFSSEKLIIMVRAIKTFKAHKMIPVFVISLTLNILTIIVFWFLFDALSKNVEFLFLFVTVPVLFLVLMVPISFAGWGLREASLVHMLTFEGIPAEISFSASILFGILMSLACLVGLFFCLKSQHLNTHTLKKAIKNFRL